MAAETRIIFLVIGALWLLWDIAKTLKRIEQRMNESEDIMGDVRFSTKAIAKHFNPPKE
jgi:hypothetical protein